MQSWWEGGGLTPQRVTVPAPPLHVKKAQSPEIWLCPSPGKKHSAGRAGKASPGESPRQICILGKRASTFGSSGTIPCDVVLLPSTLGCIGNLHGVVLPLSDCSAFLVLFKRCALMTKNHQILRKVPVTEKQTALGKTSLWTRKFFNCDIWAAQQTQMTNMCGMVVMHWNVTESLKCDSTAWKKRIGWWRLTNHIWWTFISRYVKTSQISIINILNIFLMGRRFEWPLHQKEYVQMAKRTCKDAYHLSSLENTSQAAMRYHYPHSWNIWN